MSVVFILMLHFHMAEPASFMQVDQPQGVFDTLEHCEHWRDVAQRVLPKESNVERSVNCVQYQVGGEMLR